MYFIPQFWNFVENVWFFYVTKSDLDKMRWVIQKYDKQIQYTEKTQAAFA